jgi:DNA-binding HxlR family transcriptional regulator
VSRNIVETMPPWVEYELTPRGHELGMALNGLADWGHKYMEEWAEKYAAEG